MKKNISEKKLYPEDYIDENISSDTLPFLCIFLFLSLSISIKILLLHS